MWICVCVPLCVCKWLSKLARSYIGHDEKLRKRPTACAQSITHTGFASTRTRQSLAKAATSLRSKHRTAPRSNDDHTQPHNTHTHIQGAGAQKRPRIRPMHCSHKCVCRFKAPRRSIHKQWPHKAAQYAYARTRAGCAETSPTAVATGTLPLSIAGAGGGGTGRIGPACAREAYVFGRAGEALVVHVH